MSIANASPLLYNLLCVATARMKHSMEKYNE